METIIYKRLLTLLKTKQISKHAYKTYKGQVANGDISGCIKGLQRKKLWENLNENNPKNFEDENQKIGKSKSADKSTRS